MKITRKIYLHPKQVRFLQEIGCSKLQGYYFSKPVSLENIMGQHRTGQVLGSEKAEESDYYETISRVNLYDLDIISSEEEKSTPNFFGSIPMGILEINGATIHIARSNSSYRDFLKRFFGFELTKENSVFTETPSGAGTSFLHFLRSCPKNGDRVFFDEKMPDGTSVHSFVRRIAVNPVTGTAAVAVANPALPISKKKSVSLGELAGQKLVLMERDAPYSIRFEQELRQLHLEYNPVFRLQSAQTALRVVVKGGFVTVLPLYSVKEAAELGQVTVLNISQWNCLQSVQSVLHQSKVLTPQISGFLEELEMALEGLL